MVQSTLQKDIYQQPVSNLKMPHMPVPSWLTFDTDMNQEGADCTPLLKCTIKTFDEMGLSWLQLQEQGNLQGHPNPANSLPKIMVCVKTSSPDRKRTRMETRRRLASVWEVVVTIRE